MKTFGVESETDIVKMKSLSVLLNGKNVNEIFQMADKIAKENNIDWSSTAPPSLGAINILQIPRRRNMIRMMLMLLQLRWI